MNWSSRETRVLRAETMDAEAESAQRQGDDPDSQIAYWKQQLADAPPVLELPTDRPRPAVPTNTRATRRIELPADLTASLKALSEREGSTLFLVLLAAFQTLLSRYSGQTDIAVGIPMAGNTLVIRTDLSGKPGFRDLLGRVQAVVLGAFTHREIPFDQVLAALKPECPPGCHPLFQAAFMLQSADMAAAHPGTSALDLTLVMGETADGLIGDLMYSTDLFDETTVTRMLGHFRNLAEAIVADPLQPVATLPLLSEAERYQMLVEWNRSEPAPVRLIHDAVAEQAVRTPDAIAVEYGAEHLTYRELDRRANRLAHYLQKLGVGPEVKVGLCLGRCTDVLVGLLGTLKAGGAYVPLDPSYPAERLAYMLADSQVAILLTHERLAAALPEHGAVAVCLDAGRETIARESDAPVDSDVGVHNLAYMIYTSGSTGRPKGVLVEHKGIFNMARELASGFDVTAGSRVLQFASLSFDASVAEICLTLAAGATLVLEPRESLLPSPAFLQLLRDRRISTVLLPPSALAVLPAENLPDLKTVVTAGEACSADVAARWAPGRRFVNGYGPTEVTVATTIGPCSDGSRPPSIGRVIGGLQVYLLDSALQPVPVGVPGEIYVGGIGVARGYHNRPDLTAERFPETEYGRVYRTGDLARYLPDGSLEFLGRTDDQVKIRGFRIELGEVETVVIQHPAVTTAAVVAREDTPGVKRLVAYVVPAADRPLTAADLRAFVQGRLPEYMVPSAFVLLEAMPLTANGKVDRRALPAPGLADLGMAEAGFAAPRTPVEEVLTATWADLLGLSRISTTYNFFALGGHSLLATRVLARIRDRFGVSLPLRDVFEAPTVAELAARVEAARSAAGGSDQTPSLVKAARDAGAPLPLSFAQQRLWFIDQLQPDSTAYNLPSAVRLKGVLNVTALEQALSEVLRRHESLRTTFAPGAGGREPVQVIHPAVPLSLAVTDLQHLAAEEREPEAVRLAAADAQRPFDLAAGPLFRASLVRVEADDHLLLINVHHILSDGWSRGVFADELSTLYTAFIAGQPSPLPELPVQYADFAIWQRQWLQGERLQAQLSYWKEQLSGAPALLELPTDRPRPAVQTFRGADLTFTLPGALADALKALSRREGATLFMTLLAAFQTLLYRYSGQDDVAVGTPVAGRSRVELEPLIGFFVNTLVMRADLSGTPAFRELLGRVRRVALDAYAHQDIPFEQVAIAVRPERNLSHSPLFQVAFALQNVPEEKLAFPGLSTSRMETGQVTARFDLTLVMEETADGLTGMIEYNSDLFDAATIRRLAGHFRILLEAVAADASLPVASLPLMSAEEKQQVLVAWNQTRTEYPRHRCVSELFEQQAALRPDAVAIVSASGAGAPWTYGELDRKANQLARHLRRLGVGADTLVGICMERAPETVMAMLGILKAGGAYVPLDPAYPAERLAFMLGDSGLPVLLTQERMLERLPEHGARVVCLDRDWSRIAAEDTGALPCGVTADNLACVIYTSGSTGRPKGTALIHRGVVRLLMNTECAPFDPDTCMAQVANHSFDAATFEIWGTLLHGGRLVMISKELALSPREFAATIREQGINSLILTTALFNQMAREVPDAFRTARYVLFGGEACDPRAVREVLRHGRPGHLINGYGPTESTTMATWHRITAVAEEARTVPIGRPIANTTVYVLDGAMQPLPIGVPGELYIGGDGLARGYLNRPELTAERFRETEFGRLYRTGDLVRWLPDGSLDFIGRTDNQVKIRGFRIELGELETVLAKHPAVREAVVLVREDQPGFRRLVAYVVPAAAGAALAADLRIDMREQLPDYMVPSAFVLLEALPLTPNGKVDRRALPVPAGGDHEPDAAYVAPRTPVEEALAAVWAQILGLCPVSIHDNFFELGGHSLLATRVISRLREVLQVELPVRSIFEAPTVAGLAERVASALRSGQALQIPPVRPRQIAAPVPASFAQQRLWFLDQLEPGSPVYNIPVALRLRGQLDKAALEHALSEIIRRHESLRTTFAMAEREPVQIIRAAEPVTLHAVDLRALPEGERETSALELIAAETERPFELATGPLFRASLVRMADDEHILMLHMHHIVSDGWSISVLNDELTALYAAFAGGQPAALPEPAVQYPDFALWQREWLNGDVLGNQIAYWKQHLAGLTPLQLPTDRPRPAVQTYHGAVARLSLPAALADALRSLSRQEGVTLFMTLLAAFQTLLYRYTGQADVAVGSPIAGRNRAELEKMIGFFVNTLVLRTDLSGNPSFRALLRRVSEVTLAAYAHQDLPFEMLVDVVQPERDRSRSPLFQVLFALQNIPDQALQLPGLTVTAADVERTTAKFDLALAFAEGGSTLTAELEYNTDLFDAATMNRLLEHFQTLLEGIAANADRPLAELPLISEAERQRLLTEQNRTEAPYPTDRLAHERFAKHAQQAPDAVAVVAGSVSYTYGEVNRRANQLARCLARQGVGPDVLVGLCTERTVEMIVGMLGVLKAGGAYLPVDPAYPRDRIAFMLEDAAVPVLLTQERLLPNLPGQTAARVICLDADWETVAQKSEEAPEHGACLDDLAYVIYTSGSTGRPKGVQIEHRSLLNLAFWNQRTFGLTAADRATHTAGTAFDAAVFEIWPALTCGAALYLPDEETRLSPARLRDWLVGNRITVCFVPTPLAEQILTLEWPAETALRYLHTGGDKLHHYPSPALPFALVNNYGPTESTVVATSTVVLPQTDTRVAPSIGRPIANTRVYILDGDRNPVPTGVPGELYIGGGGLARGYLNRSDLTAERFPETEYGRLYRTGDLVRWLPDGSIEFLGRIDDQVKLRGFRIELGEIESVLEQHAGVRVGVVVAREDAPGRKYLAAYIVPADTAAAPDTGELRRFLKEQLPDYMVPSAFVTLEQLPLTPNGKVDFRALPAPDLAAAGCEYAAPRNAAEELLARIWSQVLGAEQVGVHDNFFERGGNSLMAIQVVVRLRQQGYVATAQQLFEHQSIAELAERIEPVAPARAEAAPLPAPAARPVAPVAAPAPAPGAWKASLRPGRVLLTGATGYLGIYLLREILRDSEAIVYCLVRSGDRQEGMQRIADQLRWYFPGEPDLISARVRPVPGDLRAPNLGIAPDEYRHLCEHVEAIFHAAADVRHVGSKEQFQAANVAGTEALIGLAKTGRPKVLHFVSTLSVSGDVCPDPNLTTFSEHDFHIGQQLEGSHYPHSKYLAEAAVRDAMIRGCQAVIYRTGFIAADSVTGRFQRNVTESATYRMLRGIIHTGVSPYLPELMVDFTPVDFIARAIFTLSRTPEAFGQTFHLVSPHRQSLYDVVRTFQTFGYGIRLMPPDTYAAEVFAMSDDAEFLSELGGLTMFAEDQGPVPALRIDSSFTRQRLTRLGLEYPQPTLAWWQLVLKHVIEVGFVRPPAHWGKTWSVPDSGWR